MRLALHTDYALRTLLYLGTRNERVTIGDVAGFFGISAAHVAKVVNQLARLGYVRSVRGAGGGLELARALGEMCVGEVVLAFEGNMHLLECVGTENVCVVQSHCKLRTVLSHAERLQIDYLNSILLSELVPI